MKQNLLKNTDVTQLIISLLRDKIALKHELKGKDFKILELEKKLSNYEKVGFNYGK